MPQTFKFDVTQTPSGFGSVPQGRRAFVEVTIRVRATVTAVKNVRLRVSKKIPAPDPARFGLIATEGWQVVSGGEGKVVSAAAFELGTAWHEETLFVAFDNRQAPPGPGVSDPGEYTFDGRIEVLEGDAVIAKRDLKIVGNSITPKPRTVILVMDRSGSMGTAVPGGTRLSRMQSAASTLVAQLNSWDQVGLVSFDLRASPLFPTPKAADEPVRSQLTNAINDLLVSGREPNTAIVTGLTTGDAKLVGQKALILFTDGEDPELEAPLRTAASTLAAGAYAVACGPSSPQFDALFSPRLVVDEATDDSTFLLQKYVSQVLLDTSGSGTLALDPEGALAPGETEQHEVLVTQHDRDFRLVLLCENSASFDLSAIAPNGAPIQGETRRQGNLILQQLRFAASDRPRAFQARVSRRQTPATAGARVAYTLFVPAESDMLLDARFETTTPQGGGELLLSVVVKQGGVATRNLDARVELTYPGGSRVNLRLQEDTPGHYSVRPRGIRHGVFAAHFVVRGRTLFGEPFLREAVRNLRLRPSPFGTAGAPPNP